MSTKRIPPKKAKVAESLPPAVKLRTTPFIQVADRLDDTAILLHGLHRRHKNQHRVSTYWWPAFGQLRRAVNRLLEDVRRSEENNGAKAIAARVGETRVLVPKVYLAFSRLVADKQFAPLGLLLVGVLAQVQAAIKDIEGILGIADADASEDADSKSQASKAAVTSTSASTSIPKSSSSSTKKASGSQEVDFGVAISRDSRVDSGKPAKSSSSSKLKKRARRDDSEEDVPKLAASSASTTSELKAWKNEFKPHPEKKRKIFLDERIIKDDEGVVETTEKAHAVDDELDQERKEKKQIKEKKEKKEKKDKKEKKESKDKDKKKKRKRGDEFDDLFSGLM